jgi:uncharacterized circularly permuted ATP-grasp superfamily protein
MSDAQPPVGRPVDAYNQLVADAPDAAAQWEWLLDAFRREGITFAGEPMRCFLRPHFVEKRDWEPLRARGHQVLEIAERAARVVFDGDVSRLCAFLGTPASEAKWVTLDPGPPDVLLSRLDAFLTESGPRFIEINSDAPAGFGYSDRMAKVYQELPVFRAFAKDRAVGYLPSAPSLVQAVLGLWKGRAGSPTVGIVDWAEVKTRADQELLRERFEADGVRCFLADPRELAVKDGRLLAPQGPIDIVYRRGVLTELAQRESEVGEFFRAYREGVALFANTFRCRLSEDKAFFAILTDEAFAGLFSEAERVLLQRALPWTRKVEERHTYKGKLRIDLVPWIIRSRNDLVLKPNHGYGGDSVFVGSDTEPAAWEKAVTAAVGGPWVVQERVTIPEEPFPVFESGRMTLESMKVNDNPFYVKGAEVGAVTRASRSSVINVSAGGGSLPTFVLG